MAKVAELVGVLTALVFACLTAYAIFRLEWFDILRRGTPGPRLLAVYAAYVIGSGLLGWGLAGILTARRLWRLNADHDR